MASLRGASPRRKITTIAIIITIDRDAQHSVREKVAGLLRESLGWGFWGFAAFALLSGLACYLILGPETFATPWTTIWRWSAAPCRGSSWRSPWRAWSG
jgi:hypothetical protein